MQLTNISRIDPAQHHRLDAWEHGHIAGGTEQMVGHTVLREVIAIVLVHQSLDRHQDNTPRADDDKRRTANHFSAAVHVMVANQAMVLVQPLHQVIKDLWRWRIN